MTNQNPEVLSAIESLIDWMNEANIEYTKKRYPNLRPGVFREEGGRKFIKIAVEKTVHCFIDAMTGDVYKAASWKAPALNGARYNILDAASLDLLKVSWDPHGGYLYKR